MATWEPSTLKRHEEGDSVAFQSKLTGAGVNDMCNMQELTKDTILALLKVTSCSGGSPENLALMARAMHKLSFKCHRAPPSATERHRAPPRARCAYAAQDRFKKEIVYTYVGDIIVSVNPFKNVGAVGKAIRNR